MLEKTEPQTIAPQQFAEIERKHGANNYTILGDVVLSHGEGVWLYDTNGNRYLDCLSAYSAVSQGHCHPRILQAMIDQAQRLPLASRAFRNDQFAKFLLKLNEVTGFDKALPMNSGAEAIETALKLTRKWAYTRKGVPHNQAEIIVAQGNFHGRTTTIISFSTETAYREMFGPHTPGFTTVPYGDIEAIRRSITPNTAGILIEPIQGEGGVIVPPDGYMRAVRDICTKNNILFMADEIQVGLGRTGKMFAFEHENARPDILILGKALSGGFYPVSAICADTEIMDVFEPGDHGSTYGGNPLGAAVATEALNVIVDEHLAERAAELGEYYLERLAEIPSPYVKEVRGKGLLIGIEVNETAGGAHRFCLELQKRGILCKDTHKTVIRFAPPLVIDKETIDWTIPIVTEVLNMPQN
ncbi:MAG: ornithine--oxo-acid transaminase [Ardenticatenaceae bacterium]|nr:ornithine--oxo-acid transaminase [Ardenticatenaceae bacterium]